MTSVGLDTQSDRLCIRDPSVLWYVTIRNCDIPQSQALDEHMVTGGFCKACTGTPLEWHDRSAEDRRRAGSVMFSSG